MTITPVTNRVGIVPPWLGKDAPLNEDDIPRILPMPPEVQDGHKVVKEEALALGA